jgi:peptidoglycan/xylan/chitin deacetylase (PgdA/CDA1 family)
MNVVINFHEVDNAKQLNFVLLFLKKRFQIIDIHTLKKYLSRDIRLKNSCHITIDDGHISFYKIFFPLLVKHQIPATLFVSPQKICDNTNFWFQELENCDESIVKKIINNKKFFGNFNIESFALRAAVLKSLPISDILAIITEYLEITHTFFSNRLNINVEELGKINNSGLIEIGAHTMTHPILTNETDFNSKKEISESIIQLEKLLKKKVIAFAYPNGIPEYDFSKREINELKNCGIDIAFSTENKLLSSERDKYAIPRIGAYRAIFGNRLMNIRLNKGDFVQDEILKQRKILKQLYLNSFHQIS